jgi:ParB-like chromosome segregation protein Spo0J
MTTYTFNGETFEFHEAADLFPLMGDAELKELADNIKKDGLLEAIMWDLDRKILDGRNRLKACHMAGVVPRIHNYAGNDPVGFVISKNIHRRNLNAAQKTDLLIKLIAMQPEASNRAIARTARVDHKTIAAARKKGEDVGNLPHVEKRTDTKGRRQPAAKPRGAPAKPKPKSVQLAEVTLAKNRQTPAMQSAGALMNFKYAVDHWVPRMATSQQVESAVDYVVDALKEARARVTKASNDDYVKLTQKPRR